LLTSTTEYREGLMATVEYRIVIRHRNKERCNVCYEPCRTLLLLLVLLLFFRDDRAAIFNANILPWDPWSSPG
jgi:hypothetical protein